MRALRDFLLAPPPARASLRSGPGRLRDLVMAPPPNEAARRSVAAAPAAPAALGLLCAAEDARALGVAAATLLARRARAGCGLACVWTHPEPERQLEARCPGSRAARRLAAVLHARGLDALACGRAAVVALPAELAEAVAAAVRAGAAAGAAPAVLVLGGPRDRAFDGLLVEQDRVLLITRPGADAALAQLALAGLRSLAAPSVAHAVALGPAARAAAAAGLAVPAAMRRALDATDGERP